MIDLMEKFGRKYRVTMDESWAAEKSEFKSPGEKFWYFEIWGRRGWAYVQNPTTLALEVKSKLWPAFQRNPPFPFTWARGSGETTKVLVAEKYLDQAIEFIRPRKRRTRVMTPEQREKLVAMGKLNLEKLRARNVPGAILGPITPKTVLGA